MKAKLIFVCCFIFLKSFSQMNNKVKLENLDIPTTPAVVLLDQNVTSIEAPKTVKEFGLSIINSFKDNGLPQNYGVEFNPYWIFKRNTTVKKYFEDEMHSGFVHNQSISMAFVRNDSVQNLSVGYRTNLFRVMNKKYKEDVNLLDKKVKDLNKINDTEYDRLTNEAAKESSTISKNFINVTSNTKYDDFNDNYTSIKLQIKGSSLEKEALNDLIKDMDGLAKDEESFNINKSNISDLYNVIRVKVSKSLFDQKKFSEINITKMKEFQKFVNNLSESKPVFSIDFAGAYNHFFDKERFSSGSFGRFGTWLTMNWNINLDRPDKEEKKNYLKLYILNRFLVDRMIYNKKADAYDKNSFYDLGGKVNFEFNRLSVAYEYIRRFGDFEDYRSVGSIMYKINDNVSLIGGFGKNFENQNDLVTTLGLRWGLNFNNDLEKGTGKSE
ncbi:hypothetical protein DBR39_16970 [Chryseobacterium sp. KBW03]|nr:hypothetical protein DBR39_16970 [Chryseobacterium sp. KBW03]